MPQKVFPLPTVGAPSASNSPSALSAQALMGWIKNTPKKIHKKLTVRGEGGVNAYCQSDRKISIFFLPIPLYFDLICTSKNKDTHKASSPCFKSGEASRGKLGMNYAVKEREHQALDAFFLF